MVSVQSIVFGCFLSVSTSLAAWAAEPVQQHNSNAIWFENWTGLSNASMKVLAPNGKVTTIFAASGTPVFQLEGDEVLDGTYRYELTASTDEAVEIINKIDNGRGENQSNTAQKPFHSNGSFVVSRGVIITPDEINEDDS